MTRRFPDKRLTLAELQTAMNYGKPSTGFAHTPEFMHKIPRQASKQPRQRPEEELQIACCQFLDLHPRIIYWATPNSTWVGKMTPQKMGYLQKLKRTGIKRGIPDLSLFFRNRNGQPTFCWGEMKSQKGVTSDEQENYMEKLNERGGFTGVIRSIEDLENLLKVAGY